MPSHLLGQTCQQGSAVKELVDVGDQHIRPAAHFHTEIVGAYFEFQRQLVQGRLIKEGALTGGRTGCFQLVVKSPGVGTAVAIAGLVWCQAAIGLRSQLQHAQVRNVTTQLAHRIQRRLLAGVFACQIQQLVQVILAHGFKARKQGSQCFAGTRGCLDQEAARGGG